MNIKLFNPLLLFMTALGSNFYLIFQGAVGLKHDEKMRIKIENEI